MGDEAGGREISEEELVAAIAGGDAPVTPSVAPARSNHAADQAPGQPVANRKPAYGWWIVGLASVVIAVSFIVMVVGWVATSNEQNTCRGVADTMDAMSADYTSNDGEHWQATFACVDGGSTTINVRRADVPGVGDDN